jgi:hypothetical protein
MLMAFWKRINAEHSNSSGSSDLTNSVSPRDAIRAQPPVSRPPIRVSAEEPAADFQTLAEAIQAARPFDTITIGKGIYREDIVVDKPLYFVGDAGEEEGDYPVRLIISPSHTIDWSQHGGSFANIWLTILPEEPDSYGTVNSTGHVLLNIAGGTLELANCQLNGRSESLVRVTESGTFKAVKSTLDRDGIWSIKGEESGSIELTSSKINSRRVDDWGSDNDNGIEIEGSFVLQMQDCKSDSPMVVRDGNCMIQDCTLADVRIFDGSGQIESSTLRELSVAGRASVTVNNSQMCNYQSSSLSVMMGGRATLSRSSIVPSFMLFQDATLGLEDCIVVESLQHKFHWVRKNSTLNAVDTVFANSPGNSIAIEPGCNVHIDGQRFFPNYNPR